MKNSSYLLALLFASICAAQPVRLAGQIDNSRRSVLTNHLHPLARPAYDRGAADPGMRLGYITMVFQPTGAQQSDLETLLIQQQDRSSANFHRWLTPLQFGDRFGLAPADVAAIRSWLVAGGFQILDVAQGRNWIAFSGTVEQVERQLQTQIHRFEVNGRMHHANATNPSVPAALAGVVRFFRGLDDFDPDPPAAIRYETPVAPGFTNSTTGVHSMAPDDWATIYDVTPLYTAGIKGDGQSIAVLGRTDIDLPGYQTFRSLYSLPATTPLMHLVGPDPGLSSTDLGEAMLDLEWSGAVARNATIIYVYATSINTAAQEAVDKNLAPVISSSYSSCEPEVGDNLRYLAQQANAQGITWLVVTNDSGAAACDKHNDRELVSTGFAVSYPASIPEITAVGGTLFNDAGGSFWNNSNTSTGASVTSYIPEIGWNENGPNGIFAGGGGVSIFYPKPFWQTGPGVPNDNARDIPDISMAGASHDGYRTYHNSTNFISGGTSAATPSFAGVVALMNQYQVSKGLQSAPGMGNINPELYRMAQAFPAAFHDATTGNNNVPCVQSSPDCQSGSFGYSAGPGYDLVTGIGSVDVNALVTHWNQYGPPTTTTLSANSTNITAGTKLQLTATVKSATGGAVPTGSVAFLIPGRGLGTPDLGSTALTVSGNSAIATITVDANALLTGSNSITAVYTGDANFQSSSGTISVTVNAAPKTAVVTAHITPDPVYASASTTGITTWFFSVTLTEVAGVGATLTDFTIAGTDEGPRLSTFFPVTTIAPFGTLSTSITTTGITVPVNRVFTFSGTDANGNPWSQQLTVPFIAPLLQPEIVLSARPTAVQQDTTADPSCQWQQRLEVQELGGFHMQLTKFLAGTNDLTSAISLVWGTTEIAPFGALQTLLCYGGSTPPPAQTYELDALTDSGQGFRTTLSATYTAATAAPAKLSTSPGLVALSIPSTSGTTSAPLTISLPSGSWTASVFPANPTTSWLKLGAASGNGSGTLSLLADATNQAPGVYRATVIVQSPNAVPQFTATPVTFTLGASKSISIDGVTNGASFQVAAAPGMLMSVFGSGLAPQVQIDSALPLPLSMRGVSATINGVAAPLYYVSPTQINLQVPYEVGAGPAVLGINNNGAVASFPFNVAPTAPGIFAGSGNLVPASTGAPGDVLVLFMTGEGDINPALITGASPSLTTPVDQLPAPRLPVTVTVGGINAQPLFTGIPPSLVGVTQINFIIPPDVPAGVQPVVVTSNGISSAPVNITVKAK